ncbi:MAG: phosphoserine phosphatase SerB [Pseudomonadota bacterium]
MANKIILINVSGRDKPGLMSVLSGTLAEHGGHLLDIGQAVIHEDLALGILVEVAGERAGDLIKDTMFRANAAGSTVRISQITDADYQVWLQASGKQRFILTVLAGTQASETLHAVSTVSHNCNLNIDTVRRLTDRGAAQSAADTKLCMEMRLRGARQDILRLQEQLLDASDTWNFDFSVQEDTVFRRNRRLVAFDMDSTLITEEVMDELAKRHGVGDEVVAITRRAMAGELDFKESFRQRAALLAGMPETTLAEVAQAVQLNVGAHRLLRALKHFGYKTVVLSGGFQYVGEVLQADLGIDHVYANTLEIVDGHMTGAVVGDIVDAAEKARLLAEIAAKEGVALPQTIAIGDGANDLPMLSQAGLGVAFHAKQIVRESARHAISNFGLDAVLYLIGFSDRDITEALNNAPA